MGHLLVHSGTTKSARDGEQVSQTIGSYEILGRLGSGGMAEVFLARTLGEVGFEKRVAIKRMHPDLCREATHVQTFADEARLVAQLNHPNIVHVYAFERDGPSHYLVMEYIKGITLLRALQECHDRRLDVPPEAAAAIGVQVCDALAYAHTARTYAGQPMDIVHRDIKPANIMLTRRGQVKITDFGVARATTNLHQTLPGTGKGTLAYMAPEQLEGDPITPRADLFSLGVVLFELFVGRRLFEDTGLSKFLERRKEGVRAEDFAALLSLHPDLAPILSSSLARPTEDRYADAAAMGDDLRALPFSHGNHDIERWLKELDLQEGALDDLLTSMPGRSQPPETVLDASPAEGVTTSASYRNDATVGYTSTSLSNHRALPPMIENVGHPSASRWRLPLLLVAAAIVIGMLALWPPCDQTVPLDGSDAAAVADAGMTDVGLGQTEAVTASPATAPVAPVEPASGIPDGGTPPTEVTPSPPLDPPIPNEGPATSGEEPTPDTPVSAQGTAFLTVVTDPWSAIFIDGELRAPEGLLQNAETSLGSHRVRVVPDDGFTPEWAYDIQLDQADENLTWRFEYRDGSWHALRRSPSP